MTANLSAPIFLLCSERSGSNLVTRMMDSHSSICGPTPTHLIRTLALNLNRFGDLRAEKAWRFLTDMAADVLNNQLGAWSTRWTGETIRKAAPERSPAAVISAVYAGEASSHEKPRVFIKENRVHLFAPFLLAAFPDASLVWLTRDPRDMALSWKKSANHPGGVVTACDVWREDQEGFLMLYGALRHAGRAAHLRYEDLLSDPAAALAKACASARLEFEPQMLEFHDDPLTKKAAARIDNWSNLAKPVLTDNSQKYLTELSADEIAYVESAAARMMEVLGYARFAGRLDGDALRSLRSSLADGASGATRAPLSAEEEEIRRKRLEVIERINRHDVSL